MPYLLTEVIWKSKTGLLAHALQASATPVHGILGQEKDDWGNDECKEAEDQECSETEQWEKLIDFMLDVSDHFETAELTYFLHWSKIIDTMFKNY